MILDINEIWTGFEKMKFWSRVEKTSTCWIWIGTRAKKFPYGIVYLGKRGKNKRRAAHRVSWSMKYGRLSDKVCVLHKCDNPPCIRPSHLFKGTKADNAYDRDRKGRGARGDRHGFQTHPERRPFGDRNGLRKHPESRAFGPRNARWNPALHV